MDIAKSNTKGGATLNGEAIGKRLRKLRGERTISDVSVDTGLGWSTICMYELGKRIPEDENKITLANYYGTTVQALFYDDDIAESNIQ